MKIAIITAVALVAAGAGLLSRESEPEAARQDRYTTAKNECARLGAGIAFRSGRTGGADNAIDAIEKCMADHGFTVSLRKDWSR